MIYITISGKAHSGKDLAAETIKKYYEIHNHRVVIFHYADVLKQIASNYFNWNGEKDIKGRHLLQYLGTDVIRKGNKDFFVNYANSLFEIFKQIGIDVVVIPDARFSNELKFKNKDADDIVRKIKIVPDYFNFEPLFGGLARHKSETELKDSSFDYVLTNESDSAEDFQDYVFEQCINTTGFLIGEIRSLTWNHDHIGN